MLSYCKVNNKDFRTTPLVLMTSLNGKTKYAEIGVDVKTASHIKSITETPEKGAKFL